MAHVKMQKYEPSSKLIVFPKFREKKRYISLLRGGLMAIHRFVKDRKGKATEKERKRKRKEKDRNQEGRGHGKRKTNIKGNKKEKEIKMKGKRKE